MIETERLIIKPLSYEQLIQYAVCDQSLEKSLGVEQSSRTISEELKEALEQTILPAVADGSKNYLFNTLWTAISKTGNCMVGDLCIMGEPDEKGEIEIGYGIYEECQKQGFMTEMLGGIIKWAESQPIVRCIKASTNKTNKASYRVLEKNRFIKCGESGELLHWTLTL